MLLQSQMRPEQHKLLVSTAHIGQKATVKQQLRRQFVEQKAGIVHEESQDGTENVVVPKGVVSLTKSKPRPTLAESLDFFASTISPHIKPPKPKPAVPITELPAANTKFADDFGSFRSSALSKTKTAEDGEDDSVGRGYVQGYIKIGKNSMSELERKQREMEEDDDDEEDEEDEDDDEDDEDGDGEDDDEDGENEDDEDGEEDEDDDDAPAAPVSNIYSVAFDVKPIRANKKKRKRVALVIPGQEKKEKEEENEDDDEKEDEADEESEDAHMDDDNADDVEEESQPASKKTKPAQLPSGTKRKGAPPTDDDAAAATVVSDDDADGDVPSGPKLSRKAARIANASVVIAKMPESGKKFSRVKQDGPSSLYQELLKARSEAGGTVMTYPGTEVLLETRVSNNDLYLGDREEGKAIDKNKKKSKESYQKVDTAAAVASLPPEHRMPTLRQTLSGHVIVEIHRTEEIQAARMQLPLCSQEQEVMEAIAENDIVILSGETGSGKVSIPDNSSTGKINAFSSWHRFLTLFCFVFFRSFCRLLKSLNFCLKPVTHSFKRTSRV